MRLGRTAGLHPDRRVTGGMDRDAVGGEDDAPDGRSDRPARAMHPMSQILGALRVEVRGGDAEPLASAMCPADANDLYISVSGIYCSETERTSP